MSVDFDGSRSRATYSGLLTQTYASIGIALFCLAVTETARRIPRRRARGPATALADESRQRAIEHSLGAGLISEKEAEVLQRLGSREGWITG